MKSRVVHRPSRRRIRVPVIVGACIAASIMLPGHIFAESFEDGAKSSDASEAVRQAVRMDVATVEPPYNLVSESTGADPTAFTEPTGALAKSALKKPAATKAGFDLSQVERLRVRVWGIADLSGEYGIDADSSLSFPRVGRIEIGNMTAAELEKMLATRLSDLARAEVAVAVEVVQFRPYFIMGQVVQAGAMEWKPGLKIIQAISLARGVTLSSSDTMFGGAPNSLSGQQSKSQLTFALAQLERLKAERNGTDVEAVGARISSLINSMQGADRTALKALVDRQNEMLSEQRAITETQLAGLRSARDAAQREVKSAEAQERSVRSQLESTRSQLVSIEGLKKKRLISNSRYFEQKNQLLSAEISASEARSLVERARARLNDVEQQLILVPQQRRAALGERIEALEREVAQLRLATGTGSRRSASQGDVMKLEYNIARESEAGVQMIPATVFTKIMPGDVVIVAEGRDEHVASVDDLGTTGTTRAASAAASAQRIIEDAAVQPTPNVLRRTSSSMSYRDTPGRD